MMNRIVTKIEPLGPVLIFNSLKIIRVIFTFDNYPAETIAIETEKWNEILEDAKSRSRTESWNDLRKSIYGSTALHSIVTVEQVT